jgi:uncharacterized protein (TIGR00255 family)
MIKSMTAYAIHQITGDSASISAEIRSYNSRFLDIVLRLPSHFIGFEDKIKNRVKETIHRGRIEIKLQVDHHTGDNITFQLDTQRATAYYNAISDLKKHLKIESPVTIEQLINLKDVIIAVEPEDDPVSTWPLIDECLRQAISDIDRMRQNEGTFISRDIHQRVEAISQRLTDIKTASRDLLDVYINRLKERIAVLTHGTIEIDADRITQEAAFLAERSDITEEIVRASSHIDQFHMIMNQGEPAGRKLNFLLQELNREFNTIGSKADKSVIAHIVVEVKAELEKIREQLQNVE